MLSSGGIRTRPCYNCKFQKTALEVMMFRFSNHELDPRQHELRRGGELVHLEPQVFDLLVFLLQNPGPDRQQGRDP